MMKPAIVIVALLISMVSFGQRAKSFTHSPEEFLKELAEVMDASKKKIGRKFIEDEFAPVFISGVYSQEMQNIIYSMGDLMLDKKMKAYPEFENYVLALIAFPNTGKSEAFFSQWHSVIQQIAENKKMKKYTPEFLESSAGLFSEKRFFHSKSVDWHTSNSNYEFKFDSVPKIVFPSLDLRGFSKGDSTIIFNTSGVYFPTLERWYGDSGKIDWLRADLDPEKNYCEFDAYNIRIKGASFIVDSVRFYHELFQEPLLGQLTEKVLADKQGDKASYPKFESYNRRLEIKNVFKNVDYDGGFTMAGNKLAGTGTIEEPALLTIHRDDKPFMVARALDFAIRPDRISSGHVSVCITLDNDSIVHPDLTLKFDNKSREVVLLRSDEARSQSPYYNSYHEVDMYFEALYWNIDDPLIELGSIKGSTQHYAAFESNDYYKKLRYDALMGLSMIHPLPQIKDFVQQSSESFYAEDLARYLRTGTQQIHPMLIDLANKGFVSYDINTKWCTVNQKLFDTITRNSGKMDYDVLQFNSDVDRGNNAQLNLLNYNLLLKGIGQIHLSDSQQVTIYPSEEQVILKKNRDFKFGGRIWAGNFEFMGKEYNFKYDEFQIDLKSVDSCRIYVEDMEARQDQYGNRPKLRVKNVLEDIAGTLKIDAPTNKSGVQSEQYPQYPIFDCSKNSYVYYDSRMIQEGVYNRDNFYYQIQPFTIDSLDNFVKEDLEFNGTLISGGIFPDIEEALVLMDDLSLGFDRDEPGSGLPIYGGTGNFTNEITLDYDGLHGNGDLDYLTTTATSDFFVFFPDSTRGRTTNYVNREQPGAVSMPQANAEVVDIAFHPRRNILAAATVEDPLVFFKNEATLDGELQLTPDGMTGVGTMAFTGAELDSKRFTYTTRKILADTADFRLSQTGLDNLAFRTTDVNADIDFDNRVGEFKSNGGETKIEFPTNQYVCFMDEFKWFMDDNEMELTSSRKSSDDFVIDTSEKQSSSNFFSVNELQDSLNFLSPKAIYDIDESLITCSKIKYIAIADSKITPDSGMVKIRKRAKMDALVNSTIVSNYVTQFHRIYNATLNINGRLDYDGEGDYTYVDENKNEQIIHIAELAVDTTLQTIGAGYIEEEDEFFLSPFFEFYGDFELFANQEYLAFEGGTRILHTCDAVERNWLKFTSVIDPNDIYIPIDTNLRDMGARKLGVGVMVADDTPIELYSAFLSAKKDREDQGTIEALGFLHYDKPSKKYKVGSKEKIKQSNLPGNLVELNTENCEITGAGKIDFQVELGLFSMENIGTIRNNSQKDETTMEGITALNFLFDEGALKYISDQIAAWPGLSPVDITKTQYEYSIKEIMGLEESDKVISDLNINGEFKRLPKELQSTFFLADTKWEWNALDESYQTVGAIGIATIDKKQLFRYVKGKIEIEKRRSADVVRIYLELDPANWYYFEYKLNIMNVSSSDKAFMTLMSEIKDDKRKIKENKQSFTYQPLASKKKRNDFVDRFSEFD